MFENFRDAVFQEFEHTVLVVNHTADQTVFPSHIDAWMQAAGLRGTRYELKGAPHYADDKPELVAELCDLLVDWGG